MDSLYNILYKCDASPESNAFGVFDSPNNETNDRRIKRPALYRYP